MFKLVNNGILRNLNKLAKFNNLKQFHKKNLHGSLANKFPNSHETNLKILEDSVQKLRIYDEIDLYPAALNWQHLLDKNNLNKINENNLNRKGNGDIANLVKKTN